MSIAQMTFKIYPLVLAYGCFQGNLFEVPKITYYIIAN